MSLLLASTVAAQQDSLSEAFREQYVLLNSQYAKNPDDVANLMDMAHFYSNADNPQYNLAYAADLLGRAEELYTLWLQDKGRYRDMQRLIKKGITLSLIRQQRQSVTDQAEAYVRRNASQMGLSEINAFLSSFPDNAAVTTRLHSKKVADEYHNACRENTIEAYYSFLIAHPSIPESDSAEAALERLAPRHYSVFATEGAVDTAAAAFPSSRAMQHAAMRQKSRIAYHNACRVNTEEAYSSYLEHYPRGDNYLDALNHLQTLRSMDFALLSTVQEYADYAETHSDDPLADSALARLRAMIFGAHSQEAAVIYLEHFPLDEHHSDVYKEYYSWFAAEGNRQPIESFAADNPDYPFQMAVQSDLARGIVFDSFDLTKPFVETDFNRLTDCIHLFTGRRSAFVALQRVLQQQIARRDWNAALQRMNQFEICFEDNGTKEYAELATLLKDKEKVAKRSVLSRSGIHHVFSNHEGTRLYFTEQDKTFTTRKNTLHARRDTLHYVTVESGGTVVGCARRAAKGKGAWEYAGRVQVAGVHADVTALGFYDNGRRVLLGVDGDIWSAQVVNDTLWTDAISLSLSTFSFAGACVGLALAAFAAAMKSGWKECPEIPHAQTLSMMQMMDFIRRQLGISYEDIQISQIPNMIEDVSSPQPSIPAAETASAQEAAGSAGREAAPETIEEVSAEEVSSSGSVLSEEAAAKDVIVEDVIIEDAGTANDPAVDTRDGRAVINTANHLRGHLHLSGPIQITARTRLRISSSRLSAKRSAPK